MVALTVATKNVPLPAEATTIERFAVQLKAVRAGRKLRCAGCTTRIPVWAAYRCLYCGLWFCQACASTHFGATRGEYYAANAAERGEA